MILTRRLFVASIAGASASLAADKPGTYPSEVKRYADEATETTVVRLTDPAHQSWLPAALRTGDFEEERFPALLRATARARCRRYRLDLKNGQSRALTETPDLVTASLTLAPDEREFAFLAGRSLYMGRTNGVHAREIYRAEEGFTFGTGFSLAEDGLVAALVEEKPGLSRLRLITMRTGAAATVVETSDPISDPQPRPKRAGLLYRKATTPGWSITTARRIASCIWRRAGLGRCCGRAMEEASVYLNIPDDRKQLNNIREFTPDTNEDQFVSATSQFADVQSQCRHQRVCGRERQQSFAVPVAAGAVGEAGAYFVPASRERSAAGNSVFFTQ